MSVSGSGPVLVITTPTGRLAQRVDTFADVGRFAQWVERAAPEFVAEFVWEIDPHSTVRDAGTQPKEPAKQ